MALSLLATLERGTVRACYSTVDFESAIRGLLVHPLQASGMSSSGIDAAIESVLRREESGTTRSGALALPHARISGIPQIIAGLGVNANGVYGDSEARVVLTFVSPMDAAGDHLRFLSIAARTFRDRVLLERVQAATSRDAILDVLREANV